MIAAIDRSTRRGFLKGIGSLPALGALQAKAATTPVLRTAYVGSRDCISVFQIGPQRWNRIQAVPADCPSFLAISKDQKFLLAVNEVDEYLGLPAGSVESYAVHPTTGQLTLVDRQSLSLSATRPRCLSIAPDGQHLVVAAFGGGAYNLFPLSSNGKIGRVSQILKEIGCGVHPVRQAAAHPHSIVHHPTRRLLFTTDSGSDRINVFAMQGGRMVRTFQFEAPAGSGPADMVMHPSGSLFFVRHELASLLTCYHFDASSRRIRPLASSYSEGLRALTMHPSGRYCYSSGPNALTAWKIQQETGVLSHLQTTDNIDSPLLSTSPDGRHLYLLSAGGNAAVVRLSIEQASGKLGQPLTLVDGEAPLSLALLHS